MKNRTGSLMVSASVLVLPILLGGCDKEVSHTENVKVNSDGSSKSEETTVKQSPNGTVTKEETTKKVDSDGDSSTRTKTTVKSPDGTVIKEETNKTSTP